MVNYYQPTAPVVAATPIETDRAHLILSVPADAVVYLNNQRMSLEGASRTYFVPGLQAGKQYRYPVKVEVVRAGRMFRANTEPMIISGREFNLQFVDTANQPQFVTQN
jgi:uncharacterized protein (TIGR03000 family)